MRASKPVAPRQNHRIALAFSAGFLTVFFTMPSPAFPIGGATFKDNAPFAGCYTATPLTSSDGLLTLAGWADAAATTPAAVWQWWWILGIDSGTGNGALLDGAEAMTLQFDTGVGASSIFFLYTGGIGGTVNNLARLSISGFSSDPQAYEIPHNAPRISNLQYASGTLTFDYLQDNAGDFGQLFFAHPVAGGGRRLKITGAVSPNGDATSWGAALYSGTWQETFGQPAVVPVNVRHNFTNTFTTADGVLTMRGYADTNATVPANFGTYLDQCFGVYGGANTGAVDSNECITLQFAPGFGLSRLEGIYSSGQVSLSGFASDPGFTDPAGGSFGATYSAGVVSFYPMDGGRHIYFFTNRAASAGRTLRVTVDPTAGYQFAISEIEYSSVHSLTAGDVVGNSGSSQTAGDGLLTINAYVDTPGTVPGSLYQNVDWFGVAGGNNSEAIDGTESLALQFSGGAGLTSLGTRYTSGQVVISGFASDPGFNDPSGTATSIAYADGILSYTFNAYRAPELLVQFSNPAASAGRSLSLHTDGNAGSQMAVTRINYAFAPVQLSVAKVGSDIVLSWPMGTLMQATNPAGIYNEMTGVASPYTNALPGPQRFFRVKVQ